MNRVAVIVATCCGIGYWPWGPGTVASLAAVAIAVLLQGFLGTGRTTLPIFIAVLFGPGVWAATRTARLVKAKDPGIVVIDEVLGQWVTLLGATVFVWKSLLGAFLLFRVFDIWKPWPIRNLEKLPEGFGIVADDIAAGIYAALILYIGGALKLY